MEDLLVRNCSRPWTPVESQKCAANLSFPLDWLSFSTTTLNHSVNEGRERHEEQRNCFSPVFCDDISPICRIGFAIAKVQSLDHTFNLVWSHYKGWSEWHLVHPHRGDIALHGCYVNRLIVDPVSERESTNQSKIEEPMKHTWRIFLGVNIATEVW